MVTSLSRSYSVTITSVATSPAIYVSLILVAVDATYEVDSNLISLLAVRFMAVRLSAVSELAVREDEERLGALNVAADRLVN
jgi:hypothetical protein